MKSLFKYIAIGLTGIMPMSSCSDFLDEEAQGIVTEEDFNTAENVDQLCNAAYSSLGNTTWHRPLVSLWSLGCVRSGDTYKGGGGTGDCGLAHQWEVYYSNTVDNEWTDNLWVQLYLDISRVNTALEYLNILSDAEMPNRQQRIAEMKFLRGHYYFTLKILFKHVPFIDETMGVVEKNAATNRDLSNAELWARIAQDFSEAAAVLPANQTEVGRPTKWAAKAYQAKTLLYAAYVQGDDNNTVTSIDKNMLKQAGALCDEVIGSGKYALAADFANNFLTETENGCESVFAVQYSSNDGTIYGRIDEDHALNYPMASEYPATCGFHQPSHNLINAFKTEKGLPMFETFYDVDAAKNGDFNDINPVVDPRLDHTVGIPGRPFKYEPDFVYQKSWSRVPGVYSYYSCMKELVSPNDPTLTATTYFAGSAKNIDLIRYDDVLLWKAEVDIELGENLAEARDLINQIRERAANSTAKLVNSNGQQFGNYEIATYNDDNYAWNQESARQALRWERRLEFATEGNRFFDLVRWGIAADYLNSYIAKEKEVVDYLRAAKFTENRDEYLPIPLNQINYSGDAYQQNAGW